uniref:VWFA domain-containing protein n=1 Tax=Plectus sambesii TaxID=2011161 RepID=A0A914VZU1_9BILA
MDALSTLGTEENFQKELQFVANVLLANWTIGHNLTQVVPALMQSDDMISYGFNEIHSLADLQHDVLAYGSKSIKGQRPDALEAVFYLITPRITNQKAYKSGARVGIDRILVLFLSFMPNDNSDLTGSIRYANEIKAEGTTIAIVGMGPNMNVTALSALASGPQYLFTAASYDDLDTNLANGIKQVICVAN